MELLNKFPEVIDNTMRVAYDGCPRKFQLAHIHHLHKVSPSIHPLFGGAYAKGLEVMRKEYYGGNEAKANYIGKGLIAAIREWDKSHDDPMLEETKSLLNCLCALIYYTETWPLETDWLKPLMDGNDPRVEFTFAIPLPYDHPETGNPILYTGRFDMFADFSGAPAVEDDKTASQLGASWINGWDLDSQPTGYIWAAQQHGIPATTAIFRGVSILKKSFGHAQAIQHRTKWQVEQWYETMCHNLESMLRDYERQKFAFSFGDRCKGYGGCPYKLLCSQENWEEWIEPEYHVSIWNPLDIHEEKDK